MPKKEKKEKLFILEVLVNDRSLWPKEFYDRFTCGVIPMISHNEDRSAALAFVL